MRWLNKYHRGFNRLWLVFSCLPFFICLLTFLLSGDYKPNRYVKSGRRLTNVWGSNPHSNRSSWTSEEKKSEDIIAAWVQEQWRKDKPWKGEITTEGRLKRRIEGEITTEDRFKRSIVRSVRLMKAAKSFTDTELTSIIDLAVKAEKTYPSRVRQARSRGLKLVRVGFIVSISIYSFGHGLFCLIVWIIRGFR